MVSLLFIFTASPYTSRKAADGLEALMAACSFEYEVNLLLLSDAVWSIKADQEPPSTVKAHHKTYAALDDFGVSDIYVYRHSLIGRGLTQHELNVPVRECDRDEVAELIARH